MQLQGGAAAPDPAAYGLSPPLFQPLTAYAARGRIFPAPARGNRVPRVPIVRGVPAACPIGQSSGVSDGQSATGHDPC